MLCHFPLRLLKNCDRVIESSSLQVLPRGSFKGVIAAATAATATAATTAAATATAATTAAATAAAATAIQLQGYCNNKN